MQKKTVQIGTSSTDYFFAGGFSMLKDLVSPAKTVIITDENVFANHKRKIKNWKTIVISAGEENKVQTSVDNVINQLIELGADRTTTLVGLGGGVITDLTGYIASIYMRGISFGFVPTTLLALVDASIGGKNGIDLGDYKNMIGTIRHPSFIIHDLQFLNSLPEIEWNNGFAEIIKHACIKDMALFKELESIDVKKYRNKKTELCSLIQKNVLLKTKVVQRDERETGDRKLLNFGHTLGHAIENQYGLPHGQAIAVGMSYASELSQKLLKFQHATRVTDLLQKYGLPTTMEWDKDKVFHVLKMDKKKQNNSIHFILLEKLGKAVIKEISLDQLYETL